MQDVGLRTDGEDEQEPEMRTSEDEISQEKD